MRLRDHRPLMHKPDEPAHYKIPLSEGNSSRHVALAIARHQREPVPEFSGTGCVMAAGGRAYLRMAFITIARIRMQGWRWPVQIWHLGAKELPSGLKERFRELDVQFVDAEHVRRKHYARRLGGWELKSYAVAHCPFRNVLLLDADCIPARDPIPLFESPEFQEVGAVFWPDIQKCRQSNVIFNLTGVAYDPAFVEGESGQIMVDKTRHWKAWQLVRWFNDFSDFYFRYLHGDKDLPIFSFLRTKHSFRMGPPCTWEGWGIQHYWLDGEPLFCHHMDRKRNPKAPVPQEHIWLGRVFDENGSISAIPA